MPHTGEAAIRLLSLGGCQVTIAQNNCCGLPAWSYGDFEAADRLARQNVDLLSGLDFDFIVSECGSCTGFLKDYAELLPDSPPALALSERARDITEVLSQLSLPTISSAETTVTYHDPCHLGRQQGITEAPRKLLVDSGCKLVEMAESGWCCGGAGSYNLSHPEMSQEILARKMSRIADTGAEVVTTSCPACIIQLESGVRSHGLGQPVRHVVEVLTKRLGF